MKRRKFLQSAAAAVPLVSLGTTSPLFARGTSPLSLLAQLGGSNTLNGPNDKILVVIQLFGGNDGLNTVVPALDDKYYTIRPQISIPKPQLWNGIGDIYLHPALTVGDKGGIAGMLTQGTLAIVQGVGYDRPNLSHFRSTDIWLSGINNSDPNVRLDTGWHGRFLEKQYPDFPNSLPKDPLAVNFGGFSLALTSEKGRMGIEVDNPALQTGGLTSGSDSLDANAAGSHYQLEYAFVEDIAARSNVYAQRVKDAYNTGRTRLKANYASDGFSQQMAAVASLIAGGLGTKVYFVGLGGFDTHVSQQTGAPMSGAHPALLARLADGVAQFQYDMLELDQSGPKVSNRVIGMTVSEFGRRPYENGSLGTDHGAASVQFLFGSQINSGVYGNTPDLSNFDANGDLPWQIDYRQVYSSVLNSWFGLTLDDARTVLQDQSITPLDIIKAQNSGVSPASSGTTLTLQTSPNPFIGDLKISFALPVADHVRIDISDMTGRTVATPIDRNMIGGNYAISLPLNIAAGTYLMRLRTGSQSVTRLIQCVR